MESYKPFGMGFGLLIRFRLGADHRYPNGLNRNIQIEDINAQHQRPTKARSTCRSDWMRLLGYCIGIFLWCTHTLRKLTHLGADWGTVPDTSRTCNSSVLNLFDLPHGGVGACVCRGSFTCAEPSSNFIETSQGLMSKTQYLVCYVSPVTCIR